MTFKEKIFLIILTFTCLNGELVKLSPPMTPKLDCQDINNNGKTDFITFNHSDAPRTIYHIELSDIPKILWEYSMPKNKKGYFIDIIISDFDSNGSKELIAIAYQDEGDNIFYIFNYEQNTFNNEQPIITNIKGKSKINNPKNIYLMNSEKNEKNIFLLTQGSPNRQLVACTLIDNEIIEIGSLAKQFLKNTISNIDISLGDFDGDGSQDIFILDNGFKPNGYFIYSNGKEQADNLIGYPRIKSIYEESVDINFDGLDDLVMIDRNNKILSNIWKSESLSLPQKGEISKIILKPENGFIYLTSINDLGYINTYSIDPLSKSILSNESKYSNFNLNNYDKISTLFCANKILLFKNGNDSELFISALDIEFFEEQPFPNQLIYNQNPDYIINLGNNFNHSIILDSSMVFRNFNGNKIPKNMTFDLPKLHLNWLPKSSQLGYHELAYTLAMRGSGPIEINLDDGKMIVNQEDPIVEKDYSYLLYVNSPTVIDVKNDSITVVNGTQFKWDIPIQDKNADAELSLGIIGETQNANIKLIKPNIILVPNNTKLNLIDQIDTLITTIHESINISINDSSKKIVSDTLTSIIEKNVSTDSSKTDIEPLTENKLISADETTPEKTNKTKEEEYEEKLKTHKKVLKDGKNIWIPLDSLEIEENNINLDSSQISIKNLDTQIVTDSSLQTTIIDSINTDIIDEIDTLTNNTEKDVADLLPEITEISYKELIQHQAEFSWLPNKTPGNYNFTIFVSDNYSSDTTSFTINLHPHIDLNQNKTKYSATVNQMFNTKILIKQIPKSNEYNYKLINAPKNMRIDTTGTIYWVPLSTQVDDFNFNVEVSDGIATSSIKYNIFVNAPPVISSRPSKTFILALNDTLTFPFKGFDLNSISFLSWELIDGPSSMSLSPDGILNWYGDSLGHHPYIIQLSDEFDSIKWQGSIYVNSSPKFTSTPITSVLEGDKYEYPLFATDKNTMSPYDSLLENKIIFSLAQGPDSMQINENNILQWNTNDNPLGEYMVAIAASDGAYDEIQVFPVFINSIPIIISTDSISVEIGDTLKMQIEASDRNINDTLTYHLKTYPKGLNLELNNGMLSWLPQNSDIGPHKLILSVKDGHDNIGAEMLLTIFVYKPPILTSKLPSEAFIGMEYSVILTGEDLYGNKLNPEYITIDSASFNYYNLSEFANLFKWTPRDVDRGNHQLIIKLTDEYGVSSKHIHNLNVFINPCIDCNNDRAPVDSTGN